MNTKSEIMKFIKQKESSGALLVTGKWGCGKTFLIKEIIKENREALKQNINSSDDDFIIALVSLYGVDSIESLHTEVKKAVLEAQNISSEKNNNLLGKIKNMIQPAAELLSDKNAVAGAVNIALSVNPWDIVEIKQRIPCFNSHIKNGILKQLVLVFDDFERCKLEVIDLLGAINYYTETKEIKTIIVTNELKICSENYFEFKEKAISRTISCKLEVRKIIGNIIENYKETEDEYQNFLNENIGFLCSIITTNDIYNFRMLKNAIIDFENIYAIIRQFFIDDSKEYNYYQKQFFSILKDAEYYTFDILSRHDDYISKFIPLRDSYYEDRITKNKLFAEYVFNKTYTSYNEIASLALYQFLAIYFEVNSSNTKITDTKKLFFSVYHKYEKFTFSYVPKSIINYITEGILSSAELYKEINLYIVYRNVCFADNIMQEIISSFIVQIGTNNKIPQSITIQIYKNSDCKKKIVEYIAYLCQHNALRDCELLILMLLFNILGITEGLQKIKFAFEKRSANYINNKAIQNQYLISLQKYVDSILIDIWPILMES